MFHPVTSMGCSEWDWPADTWIEATIHGWILWCDPNSPESPTIHRPSLPRLMHQDFIASISPQVKGSELGARGTRKIPHFFTVSNPFGGVFFQWSFESLLASLIRSIQYKHIQCMVWKQWWYDPQYLSDDSQIRTRPRTRPSGPKLQWWTLPTLQKKSNCGINRMSCIRCVLCSLLSLSALGIGTNETKLIDNMIWSSFHHSQQWIDCNISGCYFDPNLLIDFQCTGHTTAKRQETKVFLKGKIWDFLDRESWLDHLYTHRDIYL